MLLAADCCTNIAMRQNLNKNTAQFCVKLKEKKA